VKNSFGLKWVSGPEFLLTEATVTLQAQYIASDFD